MNQLTKLITSLTERYQIDIDEFLYMYQEGATRAEIQKAVHGTEFPMRMIASALNLRWPQKYRIGDYAQLLTRSEADTDTLATKLVVAQEALKEFERELNNKDRALAKTRREANRLRAGMREESFENTMLDMIEDALSDIPAITTEYSLPDTMDTMNIDFLVLSDLHAGATVSEHDVPDNVYDWGVLKTRLDGLFAEFVATRSGDVAHVYMLGDMLDGLIHDSLEACDLNPAQAAKALAVELYSHIKALNEHYTAVQVYGLNGNHSRLTDKIKSVGKGFDFEFLMYSIMDAMLEGEVLSFEISTHGMIAAEVAPGIFVGLHHGDHFRGASNAPSRDLQILERFRQTGTEVSHLIQGHTHIFESHVLPTGGFAICNGSLIGTNGYVHSNGFLPVSSVQVIGSWDAMGQVCNIRPVVV